MRLWHEKLLPYLDRQRLLSQHRECAALRGKGWGRKHSVVDYVFTHPKEWLWLYHIRVMEEMIRRGYHPDLAWMDILYQGKMLERRQQEEVDVEEINKKAAETEVCVYPEHDDAYLEECLQILLEKGEDLRSYFN